MLKLYNINLIAIVKSKIVFHFYLKKKKSTLIFESGYPSKFQYTKKNALPSSSDILMSFS